MMRFNHHDAFSSSPFENMLDATDDDDADDAQFETDFDINHSHMNDSPMIPEHINDSSSSDEEDFADFDPRSTETPPPTPAKLQESTPGMPDSSDLAMEAADKAMNGPATESWADFDSIQLNSTLG